MMNNTYIAHHGILGQKWGVRRYQNPDGTLTAAGRRRYLNSDGSFNKRGIKATSKSNDRALTIPKGSVLYRTTTKASEPTSGEKYVTYFEQDRNFYRTGGAKWIAYIQGKDVNNLHEKQYEVIEDIKIPPKDIVKKLVLDELAKDEQKVVDAGRAYAEMYYSSQGDSKDDIKKYSDIVSKKVKSIEDGKKYIAEYDEKFNKYLKERTKIMNDTLSEIKTKNNVDPFTAQMMASSEVRKNPKYIELTEKAKLYDGLWAFTRRLTCRAENIVDETNSSDDRLVSYMQGFGSQTGSKLKNEVITKLKAQGYNAMTDEAGVGGAGGYNRETRQALIIFDADKVMKEKSTTKFSNFSAKEQGTRDYSYKSWYEKNKGKKSYGDDDE